ncbi:YkvA family protein [Hoylesella timonensis]|uniref:YkvA family protein n=1 Tax=Hoylesella timonensis TaxID=386414 RepID=UPI00189C4620|nr:YkvA family protein [Hoylesella timonensis]
METKLPDFIKYTDKFSKTGFIDKIASIAKRAGAKLVYAALVLYYTLESDQVSVKDKAMIIGALGYLISPLDVVPDAIPIAGLSDDLAVLIYVLKRVWVDVSDDVKKKAQSKMAQWFDQDEMISTDQLFSDRPEDNPV